MCRSTTNFIRVCACWNSQNWLFLPAIKAVNLCCSLTGRISALRISIINLIIKLFLCTAKRKDGDTRHTAVMLLSSCTVQQYNSGLFHVSRLKSGNEMTDSWMGFSCSRFRVSLLCALTQCQTVLAYWKPEQNRAIINVISNVGGWMLRWEKPPLLYSS